MELLLDGERLAVAAGRNTLAEALKTAMDAARTRGRIITEATADGRPIDDSMLESGATAALIEIKSAIPGELARDTLLQTADTLEAIRVQQQACGEAFAKGDESTGVDHLRVALMGWQTVRDVIEQTRTLVGDRWSGVVVSGVHGEATLEHAVGQLAIALRAIKSTSEAQDWSGLSDIVMYDMDVLAEVFVGLLGALAQRSAQA